MGNRHRSAVSLARVLLAALLALALVAAFAVPAGAHGRGHAYGHNHAQGKPLTVMTRNLYLGADLTRAFAALQAPPDRQLDVLIAQTTTIRAIVDQTNFPLRAQRVAAEIAVSGQTSSACRRSRCGGTGRSARRRRPSTMTSSSCCSQHSTRAAPIMSSRRCSRSPT